MASWITDWQSRLRSRLAMQFRGTNHDGIADAIARQAQEIEDAGQALLRRFYIDPVTEDTSSPLYYVGRAAQLDTIGAIIGQERGGVSDDVYRLYLRARIRANKSSGTPGELYGVFLAMLSGRSPVLLYVWGGNATFDLRIDEPYLNGDEVAVALSLLGDAKAAGARGILTWTTTTPDLSLAFDDASDIGGTLAGEGLGLGDATTSTTGGNLAGASQAA